MSAMAAPTMYLVPDLKKDVHQKARHLFCNAPKAVGGCGCYANEVGEAFRSMVHVYLVRFTYVVASGYVVADAVHKGQEASQANLADFSDNQWVTCFQESAELILGKSADELGDLKDTNEAAYDQAFQDAMFKSYIFRLRAKIETYNDESRLKTICVNATPVDWTEQSRRLIEEIEKLQAS